MKPNVLLVTFFLSLIIHSIIMFQSFKLKSFNLSMDKEKPNVLKIKNLRLVGKKDGVKRKLLTLGEKKNKNTPKRKESKPTLKSLSINNYPSNPYATKIIEEKSKKNKIAVREYLKTPTSYQPSVQKVLRTLDSSDLNVKFELPEGVKEDELNKRELVFYSFQKRAVTAYINSFYKELYEFQRKNPRTQFPPTRDKQRLAGRLIYDKNGDILEIKTLAWSDITIVQDLFMRVLKNMQTLPNPPEEIVENDKFAINFILNIN